MLGLSRTCGYAIVSLICLDRHRGKLILARDVSRCANVALPYLAKVLGRLVGAGLVASKRGVHGGFQLTRPAAQIRLLDAVRAVEGDDWASPCLLGLDTGSCKATCPTQGFWTEEIDRIASELRRITVADISATIDPRARTGEQCAGECEGH